MKKLLLLAIACFTLHVGFTQDKKTKTPKDKIDTTAMHKTYTCPMHPAVLSDKPGKCPDCGMGSLKYFQMKSKNTSTFKI